jgi:hypothetical protein
MKKIIILSFVVAAMCSCNNDIYDNIKEEFDGEIVYPAGYKQYNVIATSGFERVEIDLLPSRIPESEVFLPKAVRTVVEYGDKRVVFEPARSWVNITGLTIPQTYRFKIYTEDEWGDRSKTVEVRAKPFTEDDKNAYAILTSYIASASRATLTCRLAPNLYTFHNVTYSYTDRNDVLHVENTPLPYFTIKSLPTGESTQVNLSYKILVNNVIDTVVINDVLTVQTLLFDVPINVVLQKPTTWSNDVNAAGQDGTKAVDGVNANTSRWLSNANNGIHWLVVDLQGTFTISEFKMWQENTLTEYLPTFKLQVNDNCYWVDVIDEIGRHSPPSANIPTASTFTIVEFYQKSFTPVTTDQVRFYIPAYTGNRQRMFEMEVWGVMAD